MSPVHVESQAVDPALGGSANGAPRLVVAVSTEVHPSDSGTVTLPRITYAFN